MPSPILPPPDLTASTPPAAGSLQHYLADRRRYEIGLWLVFISIGIFANTLTAWFDTGREGHPLALWKPLTWEASSHVMLLALIPVLLWLARRYPIRLSAPRNIGRHLLASVGFSLAHVIGMVALRKAVYAFHGEHYGFQWPQEFVYEYLKDFRTYFLLLALIYLYQLILLRLQGEASLLQVPDVGPPVEPVERPQRLLVRKLGKEFLIAVADIEWLEAAENYVNLQVRGKVYPLRSTMTAIEAQLHPEKFLRVHRRYIVNLDHLLEIEPLDTGDARLLMSNGIRIPCSRRHRAGLRTGSGKRLADSTETA
jgi:hypothetical protein